MAVYRYGRWRYSVRPLPLRKVASAVYYVAYKFVQVATGIELPCEAEVGRNFVIDHFGGIIVSGYTKFGDNCRIRSGVVIGLRRVEEKCAPVIGNNVDIGAGAKLLGPIRIGDNVVIGANAVVLCDVPENSVAVGVPAIVQPRAKVQHASARGNGHAAGEFALDEPATTATILMMPNTAQAAAQKLLDEAKRQRHQAPKVE